MTNFGNLPFEKLIAYQEARKLLEAMREAAISEGRLRDQALRAATSVCLNISEGAGRAGSADKARDYAIARTALGAHAAVWNLRMRPDNKAWTARAWRSPRRAGSATQSPPASAMSRAAATSQFSPRAMA